MTGRLRPVIGRLGLLGLALAACGRSRARRRAGRQTQAAANRSRLRLHPTPARPAVTRPTRGPYECRPRRDSAPGARIATRAKSARRLAVSAGRCGRGAALESAEVEVWAEATNGLGLEAVTRHLQARHQP